MKVVTAEYVKSALRPEDYPRATRPEIAFVGRSNVGKSTLLNVLLNKKGLAKTSKTPGKTQTVNFFNVNDRVYFVDLPGYGYAKVPKQLQNTWGEVITSYLVTRKTLRRVFHLVDARHRPTEDDHVLIELLSRIQAPVVTVATKVDKVSVTQREAAVKVLRQNLSLDQDAQLIPFSALSKDGLGELWRVIDAALREQPPLSTGQ